MAARPLTNQESEAVRRAVMQYRQAGLARGQALRLLQIGYVANPGGAERFHRAARAADRAGKPKFILLEGNRGGGKTESLQAQVVADDAQRCPGLQILFLRKEKKAMKEQVESREQSLIPRGTLNYRYNHNEGTIWFPNGSAIRLGHYQTEADIDKYTGQQYGLIVIEELTQLQRKKFEILKSCLRTSLPFRPRLYAATNPGGVGHEWVKRLFIKRRFRDREQPGDYLSIAIPLAENRHIDQAEYLGNLGNLPPLLYEAWVKGNWDIAAGAYFANFDEAKVVEDPPELWRGGGVPPHWRCWGSYDYGWVHPACWMSHARDGNGIYHTVREWSQHKRSFEEQVAIIAGWPEARRWQWVSASPDLWGDYDDAGEDLATKLQRVLRKAGLRATLRQANADRTQGAGHLLKLLGNEKLSPTWKISQHCFGLLEQLPTRLHDPSKPTDVIKTDADAETGEGGDDCYDAARYGLFGLSEGAIIHQSEIVGRPRR